MGAGSLTGRRIGSVGLVGLALLLGCGEEDERPSAAPASPAPVPVPKPISTSAPQAAPRLRPVPPPGTVAVRPGPFTDRLRFAGLALRGSVVRGRLTSPDEFGDVIALELRGDFYDRAGRLLGSGAQRVDEAEPMFSAPLRVRVAARRPLTGVASAVVSVPDYVPE